VIRRTADFQWGGETFARNHDIPIEWVEKGVRKGEYVQSWLRSIATIAVSMTHQRTRPIAGRL
jgi:hypothetical protein